MTDEQFVQLLTLLSRYAEFCTGFDPDKHAHIYRLIGEITQRLTIKNFSMKAPE